MMVAHRARLVVCTGRAHRRSAQPVEFRSGDGLRRQRRVLVMELFLFTVPAAGQRLSTASVYSWARTFRRSCCPDARTRRAWWTVKLMATRVATRTEYKSLIGN